MLKRAFDLIFSVIGLFVLCPLFLLIAILVRLDSPGGAIFRQLRVGRHGRLFTIFKFRTMVAVAQNRGLNLTVGHDPRITRVGRFLRTYKLDELPQLYNVVKGEMSLVGPRPELPEYVACYPAVLRERILSIRPGITDRASIEFRDESALLAHSPDPVQAYLHDILPVKLHYYSRYIDEQSFWLDLSLIIRTLLVILCPRARAGEAGRAGQENARGGRMKPANKPGCSFLAGLLCGILLCALGAILLICNLARLLVVSHQPFPADAIVAISGDDNVNRLRKALELYDGRLAPRLLLVIGDKGDWERAARKVRPDGRLPESAVLLEGSVDTRTDAQISLKYCLDNGLHRVLVVTSPYHSQRTQLVFDDISDDLRGTIPLEVTVIASGDYGKLQPPGARWWLDRKTLETVWLEFGKILYWELTPYESYQGEGKPLREPDKPR